MNRWNRILFLFLIYISSVVTFGKIIEDNMNGLIAAFGDFDSNRLTDVFLITDNGKSIEIAEGFIKSEPLLRRVPNIKCEFNNDSNDVIVAVIPSDFTGNAMMDLLVVTTTHNLFTKAKTDNSKYKLWLFRGNLTNLECNTTVPLAHNLKSYPLVLDFDGDMITDFIVESDDCSRQLWIHLKPFCLKEIQSNQTMAYPTSNAFINLNYPKDMSPDIYISGRNHMEYWFSDKGFDSNNMNSIRYPDSNKYKFIGQSTFVDINFDGKIDHIIPVCVSDIKSCDEPQILALFNNKLENEWIPISHFTNKDQNKSLFTFTQTKAFDYLDLFVTLRFGDFDSDGYPELVTVMRESNSTKRRVVVLKNEPSNSVSDKFGRIFKIDCKMNELLSTFIRPDNDVILVTFFDFYEDGKVDLLISGIDANNSLYLKEFINKGQHSGSFLKVLVVSGLCYMDSALTSNTVKCPNHRIAYGTNQIGPFLCYSPSDGKQTGCSGQLSQSTHFALQMPYVIFGLGDIPNFIENLTVSIPSGKMQIRQQTWFEMIPDARIVIIPFPANQTDRWIQKLYLNPSHFALSTLITLTSFCCICVIIIAILHKQELSEDVADHKEYKKNWLR